MHFNLLTFLTLWGICVSATLIYPAAVPQLERRQAPGTPEYQCHADCGGVISIARTPNYCTSSNFTTMLSSCLNCAVRLDIWKYYGTSVTNAATGCGLSAVPVYGTSTANSTMTGGSTTASSAGSSGAATTSSSTRPSGSASSTSAGAAAATSSSSGAVNLLGYGLAAVPVLLAALV